MSNAVKTIKNFRTTVLQNTEEITFKVSSASENPVIDFEERCFDGSTLQIWTGTGGMGTQLTEDTDFVLINKNTVATNKVLKDIYTGISIINPTFQNIDLFIPVGTLDTYGDIMDETDINRIQAQVSAIQSGTAGAGLDSFHYYGHYENKEAAGLYAFSFGTTLLKKKANFPAHFAKVGDKYDQMHIDAGDPTPAADEFYIGPIPGKYGRTGIPDLDVNGTTVSLPSGFRDGTLFLVKSGTDQAVGTELYIRRVDASNVTYHPTEIDAINNTNPIAVTGVGVLTQEGVAIDSAMWKHLMAADESPTDPAYQVNINMNTGTAYKTVLTDPNFLNDARKLRPVADGNYGTPNLSNESRGTTYYEFGYVKAEDVTPSGETISSLRSVIDWTSNSTWLGGATIDAPHGLNTEFENLITIFDVRDPASPDKVYNADFSSYTGAGSNALGQILNGKNNDLNTAEIQVGITGPRYVDSGGLVAIMPTTWEYRIVFIKPNLITTTFDVSAMPKTYDISAGNVVVSLPDISGAPQERTYRWTGGDGTYKLSFTNNDGATIDGDAVSVWEGEGEGKIKLVSDGSNWIVEVYNDLLVIADSGIFTDRVAVKTADGKMELEGVCTPASNNNVGTAFVYGVTFTALPRVWAHADRITSSGLGSSAVTEHGIPTTTQCSVKVTAHSSGAISDQVNIPINVLVKGTWK